MRPKGYIVWSKRELDLADPWQRKGYLQQVLIHGRAEDVSALDWEEVRRILPDLDLPPEIRSSRESQGVERMELGTVTIAGAEGRSSSWGSRGTVARFVPPA